MIDNSGPAFPRAYGHNGRQQYEEHEENEAQTGMSLRDWLAGQALAGLCANLGAGASVVDRAYELADEMLKRRTR